MRMDIRVPMGLMFSILGVILIVFGLISDPTIYKISLGINMNLWWGIALLVFGLAMLTLAWLGKAPREHHTDETYPPEP